MGHSIQKIFSKFGHSSEFRVLFLENIEDLVLNLCPGSVYSKSSFSYGPSFFISNLCRTRREISWETVTERPRTSLWTGPGPPVYCGFGLLLWEKQTSPNRGGDIINRSAGKIWIRPFLGQWGGATVRPMGPPEIWVKVPHFSTDVVLKLEKKGEENKDNVPKHNNGGGVLFLSSCAPSSYSSFLSCLLLVSQFLLLLPWPSKSRVFLVETQYKKEMSMIKTL